MGINPGNPAFGLPPAEDSLVRQVKDIERTTRENLASVVSSFKTTVADLTSRIAVAESNGLAFSNSVDGTTRDLAADLTVLNFAVSGGVPRQVAITATCQAYGSATWSAGATGSLISQFFYAIYTSAGALVVAPPELQAVFEYTSYGPTAGSINVSGSLSVTYLTPLDPGDYLVKPYAVSNASYLSIQADGGGTVNVGPVLVMATVLNAS